MQTQAMRFSLQVASWLLVLVSTSTLALEPSLSPKREKERQYSYERGLASYEATLMVEASVFFTDAIAIDPSFAPAYYHRGLSFLAMERSEQAFKDYQSAVSNGIDILDPYLRLVAFYKSRQQYSAALIVTDQLIEHMPENTAGAYWDKGQVYELMGKKKLAVAAYKACLETLPEGSEGFADTLNSRIAALSSSKR